MIVWNVSIFVVYVALLFLDKNELVTSSGLRRVISCDVYFFNYWGKGHWMLNYLKGPHCLIRFGIQRLRMQTICVYYFTYLHCISLTTRLF